MRLGILNDLHLTLHGEKTYGVDTLKNTLDVLAALKDEQLDQIYLLGDICLKEPTAEAYNWLVPRLEAVGVPYCIVPGNHDSVKLIRTSAGSDATFDQFQLEQYGRHTILCLDSSAGRLTTSQLSWMKKHLADGLDPIVLFIHHPPVLMSVPYMDSKHSLAGREELMQICRDSGRHISVFCGHYHVDKSVVDHNVSVFCTPSCYCQIASWTEDFAIDHYRVGYRILELSHGTLTTEVRYLPGNKI